MKAQQEGGHVSQYLRELQQLLAEVDLTVILQIAEELRSCGTVFVCGNGGSEANASHLALHLQEAGLVARNLLEDGAYLTALSNDHSYASAPLRILRRSASNLDALVVISGSGDSDNILVSLAEAGRIGMRRIGLLGFGGGAAQSLCDVALVLKSNNYGPVEDCHSAVIHMIATVLKA